MNKTIPYTTGTAICTRHAFEPLIHDEQAKNRILGRVVFFFCLGISLPVFGLFLAALAYLGDTPYSTVLHNVSTVLILSGFALMMLAAHFVDKAIAHCRLPAAHR